MKYIFRKYLSAVLAIFILSQFIPAFSVKSGWWGLFSSAVILSILFYIVKPVINIIMFPINLMTLNLSNWIIQITLFYIWTVISPPVEITGWKFPGISLGPVVLSAVFLVKWQVIIVSGIAFVVIMKVFDTMFS